MMRMVLNRLSMGESKIKQIKKKQRLRRYLRVVEGIGWFLIAFGLLYLWLKYAITIENIRR